MSDYIVSARKYRPDSFESLIGQDNIARTLKNSIKRGQLAHAYLFCGPRGVGKTSAARIFAKTINCYNPGPDLEPCGECESCRSFAEGRSYCIHELDAASNNGVEDIKALMDLVQIPPQTGKYSVFIIDEVHMLSQQAFNAFLKTLEEPPAHAIFILATTEKHKILPTILSRCQTYDFSRISISDIVSNLRAIAAKEGIDIDDESLHIIAGKADGAMRDALTIFDQTVAFCGTTVRYEDVMRNLNVLDYEYCFKLVDNFLAGDYASALLVLDEVLSKGFNPQYFISALGSHLRDLLVSRTGGLESLVDFPESLAKRYAAQAEKCSVKFLYDALSVTSQCEAGYRAALNQRLHIEFSLMKMCFLLNSAPAVSEAAASAPVATPARVPAPCGPAAPAPAPKAETAVSPAPSAAPAQPSPAPEKVPAAPAPKPEPRRSPRTGASLSLSSLMNGDDKEKKAAEEAAKPVENVQLPSDEQLVAKWKELAESYASKPRLANALSEAKLSFREEDGRKVVSFTVTNEAQRRWIEEKMLREMENDFCSLAACRMLRLEPAVLPEEEMKEVKYMPKEKAEDLISHNEEVRNLVMDLSLDVN
ncbi:MAG: DNA polymerase III subunit gamma/tau [Candidatus Cryptobacteroides sp.]|nr:DNA polymerase III subunit gamma/tau [Rikenellaceae bacterium]MDY5746906.1 DNA polymerase III subunit gamma/tau [Candidatus Cryptobacteroides sp.]